ncbi:type II toxin-antitoxin system VapB family antitoxin [Pannus brasiliensis CCIBt3594]|uniref:Type II toxin-antitoxin system VapB family antitoxin n=1 Tax=Pannus brasiliensis CCIBt3594 TaxID=1427578 RepID=A0AAW9R129_9CHRO
MNMNIQVQIDEALLREALDLGKQEDPKILIEEALREYIQRRERSNILELFGSIDYDESYDYKEQRKLS